MHLHLLLFFISLTGLCLRFHLLEKLFYSRILIYRIHISNYSVMSHDPLLHSCSIQSGVEFTCTWSYRSESLRHPYKGSALQASKHKISPLLQLSIFVAIYPPRDGRARLKGTGAFPQDIQYHRSLCDEPDAQPCCSVKAFGCWRKAG
jgi:hypothetical protein